MANKFYISDTHFGHEKTCTTFKKENGEYLRPFANADEMNEEMIKRWNAVVGQYDKVVMLGDIVIQRKYLHILHRLNGKKKLVMGNHDIFPYTDYAEYFYDIKGAYMDKGIIYTHIPVHKDSVETKICNVHGHLHDRRVMNGKKIDDKYFSVCVEQINFTPIEHQDLMKRILYQQK